MSDAIELQLTVWRLEAVLGDLRRDHERIVMCLAERTDEVEDLRRLLLQLNAEGGLGTEKHDRIRKALGLPLVGS